VGGGNSANQSGERGGEKGLTGRKQKAPRIKQREELSKGKWNVKETRKMCGF